MKEMKFIQRNDPRGSLGYKSNSTADALKVKENLHGQYGDHVHFKNR